MSWKAILTGATLALAVVSAVAVAGSDERGRLEGEIVQVRTVTANGGAQTEIQVRTREQTQIWLRLGPEARFGDAFRVGDRVRARFAGSVDGSMAVESIHNLRSGDRIRDQLRLRDGSCDGTADRLRQRDRAGARNGGGGAGGGSRGRR